MKKSLQLARILERVRDGEDPAKVRYEARNLLATVRLQDITAAEEHLLDSTISPSELRQLVYAFAAILGDQFALIRASLPANHIIRKILVEHEMIECFLADLQDANAVIQETGCNSDTCTEYRKLCHITFHMQSAYVHLQREDDIIFPSLKGSPCYTICTAMHIEHGLIGSGIHNLLKLIENFNTIESEEFEFHLDEIVAFLVPIFKEHIFQEDNILYPLAMETLEDNRKWARIRQLCDEMGYCGFDG